MIQKKIRDYTIKYLVLPDGSVRTVNSNVYEGKYIVFLTFYAAFNEISNAELAEFSAVCGEFCMEGAEVGNFTNSPQSCN